MGPFVIPKAAAVTGLKEKIDSLTVQGDRLYVGTSTGNLHIYSVDDVQDRNEDAATLVETKASFSKRSIEQLGFLRDTNSLVVLSENQVTLYPLPDLSPPNPLTKTKSAFSFGIYSGVQNLVPRTPQPQEEDAAKTEPVPSLVTQLVVGCRRRIVIYSWKDGVSQEVKEAPLPHSARTISFYDHDTACLAYSPTEFALFSIPTMTATEISIPAPLTSGIPGRGAFTGLTGYMTLGLGVKHKPGLVSISSTEVLITRDHEGFPIGIDGKQSRPTHVDWPAAPEETTFISPYIISVLPPGTVLVQCQHGLSVPESTPTSPMQSQSQHAFFPTPVIQIRSFLPLLPLQNIPFPFALSSSATTHTSSIRHLTFSPSPQPAMFLVTTPTDKTAAVSEGTSIWLFQMKTWAQQIDELVTSGSYAAALELLDAIEESALPDKALRRTQIRGLNAVSLFRSRKYDDAINTFLELDINPAKIVALYPESVAGRLSVPMKRWIPLFGGPPEMAEESHSRASSEEASHERSASELLDSVAASTSANIRSRLKGLIPSGSGKDDDTASISSRKKFGIHDDFHRSVETLLRYLTDRRPKVAGALAKFNITPAQSSQIPHLSEASAEELFALPNVPLPSLHPQQLLRFAQILDTALFKSYLLMRPGLLGPLCRVENWCEVSEVEEELRAREKFTELIYLYNGKKMHGKALDLLKQLSEKEDDMTDKLQPSISYLRKLGPEYLDLIFNHSRWLFDLDRDVALQVFTSEDVELPRSAVADYLQNIDPQLCARYVEYLVEERKEVSTGFHDRLAELYLNMTLSARKRGDENMRREMYNKLLHFIDSTKHYNVAGLYGLLSSQDLYEARAILLGRLGRHDQALELYAYRLQDHSKAEEYCKRVYQPEGVTSNVFLTLLRIYLRPTVETSSELLRPALDLISRHGPRLDTSETLNLLPPLVTCQAVKKFLFEALRAPIFDTRVLRDINKSRIDLLNYRLTILQSRSVKVTDARICPQCYKRIGNSVTAVHAPRGEVTHYQCREAFSRKLSETRR